MPYLLSCCLLWAGLSACKEEKKQPKEPEPTYSKELVLIELNEPGFPDSLLVRQELVQELDKILALRAELDGKDPGRIQTDLFDVDGDGIPDTVQNALLYRGDSLILETSIGTEQTNWMQRPDVPVSFFAKGIWRDSATYMALHPWSTFYYALDMFNEFARPDTGDAIYPEILAQWEAGLVADSLSEKKVRKEMRRFRRYFEGFKGRLVVRSDGINQTLWFWYQPQKRFVKIYQP